MVLLREGNLLLELKTPLSRGFQTTSQIPARKSVRERLDACYIVTTGWHGSWIHLIGHIWPSALAWETPELIDFLPSLHDPFFSSSYSLGYRFWIMELMFVCAFRCCLPIFSLSRTKFFGVEYGSFLCYVVVFFVPYGLPFICYPLRWLLRWLL